MLVADLVLIMLSADPADVALFGDGAVVPERLIVLRELTYPSSMVTMQLLSKK